MTDINKQKPRKPLRLPFEKRKKNADWGAWIFEHRVGLLSTVVVCLSCIIVFLSYKIIINPVSAEMIAIEFEKEAEPEKELTPEEIKQIELEKLQMEAFEKVQNKVSDANSKLNSSLRDSKKTNAGDIYDEMERVSKELAAGRQNYDAGMQSLKEAQKRPEKTNNSDNTAIEGNKNERAKVSGAVFVEYDLENRTDVYLHKPAYQCQYAGKVVVSITVNRNGKVTNATVAASTSSGDDCIDKMALQSALASTFNASPSAPDKQKGTITYTFVAQ